MSKTISRLFAIFLGCATPVLHAETIQALSCYLEPSADVTVGTTAEGRLTRMLVDRADHVEKGQLLAEL
ncbi:hypothetical protein, partial [Klebsiella variicola]|uniref:hypothetical protein n=1 Tax=Klebsiella variicola TaxID=244366 RepID=UPI0027308085